MLREAAGDALDMFSFEDMTTIKEYVTAGATDPPEKLEKKEKLMASLPAYYEYAKFKFERGEYDDAYIFLNNYVTVSSGARSIQFNSIHLHRSMQ